MHEDKTTLKQIKEEVAKFRDERDWSQFHTPKNLSMGLTVEAGELMEHFIWKGKEEIKDYLQQPEKKEEVTDELADVINYCFLLADRLDVDLAQAITNKLSKNRDKYPADQVRGKAKKYTEYKN